jgi:NAD(P)-dependent dehydrogenase (short-subunit alcohol dehydrogenase family)
MTDRVAVVTGASRGAGRGIALELGATGATVYVTGRSCRGSPTTEGLPGTVDDTADEVTARGGRGIAVRCDHTLDHEVEALFERVRRDHGRLDLLVNNVWGGYEQATRGISFDPFWSQPLILWDRMFTSGVRAQLIAARLAAPLMLEQRRGLIVTTAPWHQDVYLGNIFYDLAKNAARRMTLGMARELRKHDIAAVGVAPGFMRTERVLTACGVTEENWQSMPALAVTETPAYLGRAVVALASDSQIMSKSGSVFAVGDLAREYGFTDIDGRQPPPFSMPDA